ncbi:serine hydrolase domain-containing protein [Camelliibacillus cellulosilyticus]|uniref:Serine hydrolase domain-containing protein n=1 Tax=Camelliibacillus cellulosilyticus TaxID=2174486 RepID=A0ABV9GR65_9BACL
MSEYNGFIKVDDFLLQMVQEGQIPGAVYALVNKDETIAENAIGFAHKDLKIPMTLDTVFDLASLTKVCVTTPAILLLIQEGHIDLDDPVKRFYPNTVSENLTIKHLLTHTTSLPPHVPFYKQGLGKRDILQFIITRHVAVNQAVNYSDLNFMLLGFIIEKITGQSLDEYAKNHIFDPLHMGHTGFHLNIEKDKIAPTEWMASINDYQWGEVHDENAHHLGGICGHAGLFSNLEDMKKYVQMLLRGGLTETGEPLISSAILRESKRNFTAALNLNRGLGWQLVDDAFSPLGYFLSKNSYGHTGFTGTSFWIDPDKEIGVILLSNRVHISRAINMNRIRRVVHNLVAASLSPNDK